MWHETNRQKDGTIKRETRFPNRPEELIISGPHFYVGNPLNKTPRSVCKEKSDYDSIDLTVIPEDYLPRTNYVPAIEIDEYSKRLPRVSWIEPEEIDPYTVDKYYRLGFRGMVAASNERTIMPTIIPKWAGHINGVQGTAFKSNKKMIMAYGFTSSIVADFYIKTTGRSNLHFTWHNCPDLKWEPRIALRALGLACVSSYYRDLWNDLWQPDFKTDNWTQHKPQLSPFFYANLRSNWTRACFPQTHYERRQTIVGSYPA